MSNVGPVEQPPSAPPPGWYPDPTGAQRWWDGWQWGPAAPPRSETADGKTLALITHLGVLASGPILPLVIRQTEGKRNAYVRHHATEALNFQLTYLLGFVVSIAVYALGLFLSPPVEDPTLPPAVSLAAFVALMILSLADFALSILGCVRAGQERWWRYPVSIRFVRGARAKQYR